MRADAWECLDCGNVRTPDVHGRCAGCGSAQIVRARAEGSAGSAARLLGGSGEVSAPAIAEAMLRRARRDGAEMTESGIERWFAEGRMLDGREWHEFPVRDAEARG